MLDIFSAESAKMAANVFMHILENEKVRDELNNQPRKILLLTLVAYKGRTTRQFLSRLIPKGTNNVLLTELCKSGHLTYYREPGRETEYELGEKFDKFAPKKYYSKPQLYFFTNALFNVSKYMTTYNITQWNTLLTIIEMSLKLDKTNTVELGAKNIQSIRGNDSNKHTTRKSLETMGFIQRVGRIGGGARQTRCALNKYAYLLGANK